MPDDLQLPQLMKGCTGLQLLSVTTTQHCTIDDLLRDQHKRTGDHPDPSAEAEQIRMHFRVNGRQAVWWGTVAEVVQLYLRLPDTAMPLYRKRRAQTLATSQ
jgi:hypothetical protein